MSVVFRPGDDDSVAYLKRDNKGNTLIIYKDDITRMKSRPPSRRKYGTFSTESEEYTICSKYGHVYDTIATWPKALHIGINGEESYSPLTTSACSYCGLNCYEPVEEAQGV